MSTRSGCNLVSFLQANLQTYDHARDNHAFTWHTSSAACQDGPRNDASVETSAVGVAARDGVGHGSRSCAASSEGRYLCTSTGGLGTGGGGGGVGTGGQRSNARMRTGDPISSAPAKAWSGSAESVGADSPCAMPWSVTANESAADEVQAARGATASSAAAGIRSHGATSCDKMSGKRQLQQKTHLQESIMRSPCIPRQPPPAKTVLGTTLRWKHRLWVSRRGVALEFPALMTGGRGHTVRHPVQPQAKTGSCVEVRGG